MMVLSDQSQPVSSGRSYRRIPGLSAHERLPLGQGGRVAKLVGLTIDEVTFRIKMIVQVGMDRRVRRSRLNFQIRASLRS